MSCHCTDRNREGKNFERGIEVRTGVIVYACVYMCMYKFVCVRRRMHYGILFPILQVCVLTSTCACICMLIVHVRVRVYMHVII